MGSLSNLYISQSYQSLIHLGTNNTASATLIELQDGLGNSIGVSVNTGGDLSLSGSLTASLANGYVWVGNSSNKTTLVSTSSFGGSGSGSSINTGSLLTTASFNQYTSSTNIRLDNLESTSASVNISISNLNSTTASQGVSITNLNSATQSLFTSASLALVTASFDNGTRNLTFTKGNTTQFSVNIPDASGSASTNTGSLLVTASAFINTITFTKGDGTTFPVTVTTGSLNYVTGSFGAFYDTTTQSGSAGVAYSMKLNNTDISDGVIISGSGGIKVLAAGTYDLQFSAQVLADTGSDIVWIWLKKNGTNVADTSTKLVLANNEANVAAWNFVVSANANDVFELAWQSNGGHTKLLAEAAASNYPAIPSVIATMNRVDVGGGTNLVSTASFNSFTSSINLYTASMNAYTSSNDTKWTTLGLLTGSYATTSSNNFTGIQTLSDAALNAVSLVEVSSSLMLVAKGFTSASAHLSSSINSGSNLIFKYNSQTVDTIISGSGNIFPNFAPAAAGFKRYVGGSGNIFTSEVGVALSGSMAFPVYMNKNMGDNVFTLRGPVSSSAWTLDSNLMLGGTTFFGTSAANNAEKIVGGLTFSQNANWGGSFQTIAIKNALSASVQVTSNLIFGAAVVANLNSSSMNYSSNIQNGGITINNNFTPVAASANNNARIGVLINTIYGVNHRLNAGGTNTSATNSIRSMYAGFLAGSNISCSIEGTGDNTSLVAVGLLGNGLIVSGSSTNPSVTPMPNADGTHGSFIAGRYNAVDGNKAKSAETVFAVGTGTGQNNRKTGFLIDSGSNIYLEGTLNVSGSTALTGSLSLSGSLSFTGSTYGNVVALSVSSNTASIDLNTGNYFTLTLPASTTTNLNLTNVKPGVTATLVLSTDTASSSSFSYNVKQPSGSLYYPSNSGSSDIITFVAVNSTTINAISVLKMI